VPEGHRVLQDGAARGIAGLITAAGEASAILADTPARVPVGDRATA